MEGSATVAVLPRTCTAFRDPALDVLWREATIPRVLIYVKAQDLWEKKDEDEEHRQDRLILEGGWPPKPPSNMRQFWHTTVACVWVFFGGQDLGNFLRNRAATVAIWGWVLGLAGGGDLGWGQGEAAAVAATFFLGGVPLVPTKSNEKKIGEGGQSAATAAHPCHLPPLPRLVLAGSQKISDLDSAAAVATANLIQNRPINPPATVAAQYWAISSAATAAALKLTPKPAATVAADRVDLVQRMYHKKQ
ncbi:hypothetical protein C8J57DRAFT_1237467 [Mycena rebaudengoi]|nr:hypothetical protein C8J57DRAFT_1237467 [Mycena rebaudengoi]